MPNFSFLTLTDSEKSLLTRNVDRQTDIRQTSDRHYDYNTPLCRRVKMPVKESFAKVIPVKESLKNGLYYALSHVNAKLKTKFY